MTLSPINHSAALGLSFLLLGATASAKVPDAKDSAEALATEAVKGGFQKRSDYWSGQKKSAEQKGVKAQLFKGNEYWFWLGTGQEDVEISLEIYDASGNKISVETQKSTKGRAIRVVAPATGTYIVTFSVKSLKDPPQSIDWALLYGYK
jgi:hypothetical protein